MSTNLFYSMFRNHKRVKTKWKKKKELKTVWVPWVQMVGKKGIKSQENPINNTVKPVLNVILGTGPIRKNSILRKIHVIFEKVYFKGKSYRTNLGKKIEAS